MLLLVRVCLMMLVVVISLGVTVCGTQLTHSNGSSAPRVLTPTDSLEDASPWFITSFGFAGKGTCKSGSGMP